MNIIYAVLIVLAVAASGVALGGKYWPQPEDKVVCHTFDVVSDSTDGTVIFGLMEMCVSGLQWSPIWSKKVKIQKPSLQ